MNIKSTYSAYSKLFILAFVMLLSSVAEIYAQEKTRILFVFDASNSMNGEWQNGKKLTLAVKLLNESIEKLRDVDDLELGLRVYGHTSSIGTSSQDCDDTELLVPIGSYRHRDIKNALTNIKAIGTTPIARTLEKAAGDFGDDIESRNVIILITDGVEACDEDPCAVSKALQAKNIVLKPFVIGIGIETDIKYDLECIGNFFDATNEVAFKNILEIVLHQAINNTSIQVNLLDDEGNPTETNIPMSFYDNNSKTLKYNFIHTMNVQNVPDTLPIDPVFQYDIFAHTIPPASKTGVMIRAGKHNVIDIDCGQGDLNLNIDRNHAYRDLKCLVKKQGSNEILHVQDFNTVEKYRTGLYDLEILTLPRIYIKDVEIRQSDKTDIIIPQPGALTLRLHSAGYGSIFVKVDDRYEFVTRIDDNLKMDRIVLQPGTYKMVYRSKNAKESIYTENKEFEIYSGQSMAVEF